MPFADDGFAVIEGVVGPTDCDQLVARIGSIGTSTAGTRCMLDHRWCREAATTIRARLIEQLGFIKELVCIQCTYFEKSSERNWLVPWHQDRSAPVANEVEASDWTGWSRKEAMVFVHPPDHVLEAMVAVRLHLDDSTAHNGPLRVILGSHKRGTLRDHEIQAFTREERECVCLVQKGGVVVMRPLLLHASSKLIKPDPRRVLHFLFAPGRIPGGVTWNCTV